MIRSLRMVILLACLANSVHAQQNTTLYFGPDGQPLKAGKYWAVTIHADGSQPTSVLVLDVGGTNPPVTPPPVTPPVVDVGARITALYDAVADPTKAATAKGMADGYQQLIALADAGMVKSADDLRTFAKFAIDLGLARAGKANEWKPWTTGMESLTAPMDLPGVVAAYKLAAAKLGGAVSPPPVNPPNPPQPPPTTTVTKATYIYEKDQNPVPPGVASALAKLNKAAIDAGRSAFADEFEEDTVDGTGEVPDQFRLALDAARKAGLPALVVVAGGKVVRVVKSPKTEADVMEAVK